MSGRQNGYGTHKTTMAASMQAYDGASSAVRWTARYAVGKWSCLCLQAKYDDFAIAEGSWDKAAIRLMRWINEQEAKDTLRDYGPAHPEVAGRS